MSNGHKSNGHGVNGRRGNGHGRREDGDKPASVASLADARRRKAAEMKAAKAARKAAQRQSSAGRWPPPGAPDAAPGQGRATLQGWLFAIVAVAMALGMIAWWAAPLLRAAGVSI